MPEFRKITQERINMTEQPQPKRVLGDGARGEDEPQPGADVTEAQEETAAVTEAATDAEEDDNDGDA